MADLNAYRVEIDEIDHQLVKLLDRRAQLARGIGAAKADSGRPTFDPGRAKAVLEKAIARSSGDFPRAGLEHVIREVMSACLNLQKPLRVSFLGPAATYAHQAAVREFGSSVEFSPRGRIRDVFEAIERGETDYGVVPVENSTGGMVHETLDCFLETTALICSEVLLPIRHCLLSNVPMEEIKIIYSHPQTFAQCANWLRAHLPNVELQESASTVKGMIQARDGKNAASIGSELGGNEVGLRVLARDIADFRDNTTRFLVISNVDTPPCGDDKTSLMFSIKNKAGALVNLLAPFASRGINLSKIESRPSKRAAWDYVFFVDVMGHRQDAAVAAAIKDMEGDTTLLRVMGSYPRDKAARE